MELEMYERCFPLHPSCHHLQSEQDEVEGMDMTEVVGTNKVEEYDYPTNHGEEGMNNRGAPIELNYRPEVEGIDREDSDMGEDMMVEVEVVEREHEGMVLARH
jgi:hypothetical protein